MAGQVEKILKHCGLWEEPVRGPPAQGPTAKRDAVAQALVETELTCVPIDEFLAVGAAVSMSDQQETPRMNGVCCGSAAVVCGKALPFREVSPYPPIFTERLRLEGEAETGPLSLSSNLRK